MSYLDWHVGMKVVCIEPRDDPEPPNPIYGEVYTISWIGVADDGEVQIDLIEMPSPDCEKYNRGYIAKGFCPIQRRAIDISIFTALLTPSEDDKAEIELLDYESMAVPFQ